MEAKQISDKDKSYPTDYFNDQWKFWIWDNIVRVGCKKETIVEILLKKDFSYDLINQELSYEKYLSEQKNIDKEKIKKDIEDIEDSNIENSDIVQDDTVINNNNNRLETILEDSEDS